MNKVERKTKYKRNETKRDNERKEEINKDKI